LHLGFSKDLIKSSFANFDTPREEKSFTQKNKIIETTAKNKIANKRILIFM
tara:strand:+ start:224 stop:376 length:153 start_codon:yes stop_codon:yes gene_type:complete